MPTVSLTSFLKILTKNTPQKISEYNKYLTPGGYDFYWSLKEAAHSLTVGGESFSECVKNIEEIHRDVERKHNLNGLKSLSKWIQKNKVTEFFDAPVANISSPEGYLTIRLEPEFGLVINGQRRFVQCWNSTTARLTNVAAGVGVYLLEGKLAHGEFADCKGGILNLNRRELLVYRALPPNVAAMVATEFAWADSFFKSVSKAA